MRSAGGGVKCPFCEVLDVTYNVAMKKKILDDNHYVDVLKSILSFQQEALKETRLVLERGVYFYVFMISLISAYISKEIEGMSRTSLSVIFLFVFIATVFVLISVLFLCFGLYRGLLDIRKTAKYLCLDRNFSADVDAFFCRGVKVTAVIGALGCIFMIFVLAILVVLYTQCECL